MHHPHHTPQQGPPPHHLQQSRPSSIVHQQHHPQQAPPTQSQHPNPYPPHGGLPPYPQGPPTSAGQLSQDAPYYQNHPSPYNTSTSGNYSSAETPEIMAAAQMGTRPYPPISYHSPQPNSPASAASTSGHDQHRMYGAPQSQLQQGAPMYYTGPPQQYPPMPSQGGPSYTPHAQQHHPPMTSQQGLLMAHGPGQHQMQQHQGQHAPQQPNMTGSPRPKIEPHGGQIPGSAAPHQHPHQHQHHQHPHQQQQQQQQQQSQSQSQQQQVPTNGAILNKNNTQAAPGLSTAAGVNPNAAPGPIPATTPLVVRQDNNGVQWIAFEYSRDRVKMEYTIRCDVETINVDTLTSEFKTENCVYPRACCNKDQYRGNRLTYETECNSVGWALAELNPCLRGKRGLIQRAVDSWRNSNSDPRLRSRRVRRMAKISTRKAGSAATQPPNMGGPGGAAGMPPSGNMGPGSTGNMGKPSMGTMGPTPQQLHHHHNHPDGNAPGGDDVGEDDYIDAASGQLSEQQSHHRSHVYSDYINSPYASNSSIGNSTSMISQLNHPNPVSSVSTDIPLINKVTEELNEEDRIKLFGDIPESKKRKFILVDDPGKGGRVRVRVTLDTVNIKEIPDSFRKSNSVYPRSWFPLQMQSPPPSANGSRFFKDDDEDDLVEVTGRALRNGKGKFRINVCLSDGVEGEIDIPRMCKSMRRKEVRLNDLGYRMTWHQSRVFADKTVFLQKALDSYRNKVRTTMESIGKDVPSIAPHFETRVGKRRWGERNKRERRSPDDA